MAPAAHLTSMVPNHFIKRFTLDGTSGAGAVGTVAVATVTERILILRGGVFCLTSLAGASATISFGSANTVEGLLASTTATDIDADDVWNGSSPTAEIAPAFTNQLVNSNLIFTVGTAAITAGVLEVSLMWLPASANGNLAFTP